ncbi:aspartic proteinase CDR1-like [Coffea arabica]|uniref:Aspartic proteinase CDR1-like n=1 Tax=Coffea arabica TaxID=13443 RepID=A0ABM4UFW9_COFAR
MAGNCPVPFSSFSKLSLLVFINLILYPFTEGQTSGFSTHLIHRDSPKSPLYNPSESNFERLHEAFHRSFARAQYFNKRISHSRSKLLSHFSSDSIQSNITSVNGEYLIKVSIGTPAIDVLAIADTGSDLTWTQCRPCIRCFKQDAPLFDPSKSTTYKQVLSCRAPLCRLDPGITVCYPGNICGYGVAYGDNSFSDGDLATDTFTFESSSGGNISIANVAFGCGHENGGIFGVTSSGIVGLSRGALSIVRQLNASIAGKFSYCLTPRNSYISSKIHFGTNAVVSGPGVVSNTLFKKAGDKFYYLDLIGFSVGNITIRNQGFTKLDNSSPNDGGNVVLDSGATLTYVPRQMYQNFESGVIDLTTGTRVPDPGTGANFRVCYNKYNNLQFPEIVAVFSDADLIIPPNNIFVEVSKGVVCSTIVPTDGTPILGNLLQINFLIGYDLVNGTVSFLPTDCTKND